jgi:formate hydrogenlyase subunit 6/NADH:ubiquinone oxidoreductase subunit I
MDQKTAAAYCGVCVETFKKVCPVRPLKFTESTRGERYLRQRLDEWLASLDPNKQDAAPKRKFGERLYGGQSEAGRA